MEGGRDEKQLVKASRRCTDVMCLIAIFSCWFCMTVVGLIVVGWIDSEKLPKGDPRRLVHGLDYLGSLCSVDSASDRNSENDFRKFDVRRLPKSYTLPSGASVCLERCPKKTNFDEFVCQYEIQEELNLFILNGDYKSYWERGAKGVREYRCNYVWSTFEFLNKCIYDETPDFTKALASSGPQRLTVSEAPSSSSWSHASAPTTQGDPTRIPTPSTSETPTFKKSPSCEQSLGRDYCDRLVNQSRTYYCYSLFCPDCPLPGACDFACNFCETAAPTATVDQKKDGSSTFRFVEKLAADFQVAYIPILIFGCGVSVFASFVYLMMLQIPYCLSLIIWGFASIVFFALFGCGVLAAYLANVSSSSDEDSRESSSSEEKRKVLRAISGIMLVASAFYACFLLAARKRIALAIGIVREAARALSYMPALFFLPLLQCAGNVAFFLVWIVYATHLASSGTIKTKTATYDGVEVSYKSIDYSRDQHYAAIYFVFAWYWTTEFVEAMGTLVVASAVANWYFNRSKPRITSPATLLKFVGIICKRHAGTAAFGGLVVAAVRLIRSILEHCKRRSPKGRLASIATSCVTCCFSCLQRCIKFVNKHAYVETAIKGLGFCAAGCAAISLISANGVRVFGCSVVSGFVLTLGKLAVALATAFGFYVFLATFHHDDLYSYLPSTILVFLMALASVSVFSQVFDATITALLHCFLVDEAEYADHPYADDALRDVVDSTQEKSRNRLKLSNPKSCWRYCFSKETIYPNQLRATFDEFDEDKSGYVSPSELEAMLEQCVGSRPAREELDAMMRFIDKDHDGYVNFSEFVAIHQASLDGTLPFRGLSDAIRAFDDLLRQVDDTTS